jgi:hypothetical protein
MLSRILASLGAISVWTIVFTALDDDIPAFAAYAHALQSGNTWADTMIQTLMRDHVQIPSVLTLMLLAVLWAPVLDRVLPAETK